MTNGQSSRSIPRSSPDSTTPTADQQNTNMSKAKMSYTATQQKELFPFEVESRKLELQLKEQELQLKAQEITNSKAFNDARISALATPV